MDWQAQLDRYSYNLGMTEAFCECVAAGCKRSALSPPLQEGDIPRYAGAVAAIAGKHGVRAYLEPNTDLPPHRRVCWYVLYRREEALREYLSLREQGRNPLTDLQPFHHVLSYGTADDAARPEPV